MVDIDVVMEQLVNLLAEAVEEVEDMVVAVEVAVWHIIAQVHLAKAEDI